MSTSTTDNTPSSCAANLTNSFTTEVQNFEDLPSESLEDITLVKLLNIARAPVFLVHSSSKNQDFALKIFNLEGDKPSKYFENESRFIEIYHPNVIALYHVDDQIPFSFSDHEAMVLCILMEYAPYGDLSKFMRKLGENFTEKLARTYFRQLIERLEYLHSSDICHLDLKLENLLIGEDGQLKIADFDLSYVKGDSHILSRGTKYYRAPELKALKKNVSKRADVYSAGVLLFVLKCFGVLPHTEDQLYRQYDLQNLLKTEPEEFFKAHSIIQKKDSSFFDDDFKDLFIAMTKENPEERMKLRHIKQSKWYRGPVYSRKELKQKVFQIFN